MNQKGIREGDKVKVVAPKDSLFNRKVRVVEAREKSVLIEPPKGGRAWRYWNEEVEAV